MGGLDTISGEKDIFQYVQENISSEERFRLGGEQHGDVISKTPSMGTLWHGDAIFAISQGRYLGDDSWSEGIYSPRIYVLWDRRVKDWYFDHRAKRGFTNHFSNVVMDYTHWSWGTKYPIGHYYLFCAIFSNLFANELLNEYQSGEFVF